MFVSNLNGKVHEFAEASLNVSSLDELKAEKAGGPPSELDLASLGINGAEWRTAIEAALSEKSSMVISSQT